MTQAARRSLDAPPCGIITRAICRWPKQLYRQVLGAEPARRRRLRICWGRCACNRAARRGRRTDRRAIAVDPDQSRLLQSSGRGLRRARRARGGRRQPAARRATGTAVRARTLQPGHGLAQLGALEEAVTSFATPGRQSQLAEAHYNLANALRELNRLAEAEASYRDAIRLRPELHLEAMINLGNVLRDGDAWLKPIEVLQRPWLSTPTMPTRT